MRTNKRGELVIDFDSDVNYVNKNMIESKDLQKYVNDNENSFNIDSELTKKIIDLNIYKYIPKADEGRYSGKHYCIYLDDINHENIYNKVYFGFTRIQQLGLKIMYILFPCDVDNGNSVESNLALRYKTNPNITYISYILLISLLFGIDHQGLILTNMGKYNPKKSKINDALYDRLMYPYKYNIVDYDVAAVNINNSGSTILSSDIYKYMNLPEMIQNVIFGSMIEKYNASIQ
jgi:hypothetical protein